MNMMCCQNKEYTPPKEDLEDHEPDTMYPEGHTGAPKSYMRVYKVTKVKGGLDNYLRFLKVKKRRYNHSYE